MAPAFKHVLVFEQRASVRNLLQDVLEKLQYRVSLAANATEAKQALTQGDVDLLIANVAESGGEARTAVEHTASVGLSSLLMPSDRTVRESFGQDAAPLVDSPFTLARFRSEVTRILIARLGPSVDV